MPNKSPARTALKELDQQCTLTPDAMDERDSEVDSGTIQASNAKLDKRVGGKGCEESAAKAKSQGSQAQQATLSKAANTQKMPVNEDEANEVITEEMNANFDMRESSAKADAKISKYQKSTTIFPAIVGVDITNQSPANFLNTETINEQDAKHKDGITEHKFVEIDSHGEESSSKIKTPAYQHQSSSAIAPVAIDKESPANLLNYETFNAQGSKDKDGATEEGSAILDIGGGDNYAETSSAKAEPQTTSQDEQRKVLSTFITAADIMDECLGNSSTESIEEQYTKYLVGIIEKSKGSGDTAEGAKAGAESATNRPSFRKILEEWLAEEKANLLSFQRSKKDLKKKKKQLAKDAAREVPQAKEMAADLSEFGPEFLSLKEYFEHKIVLFAEKKRKTRGLIADVNYQLKLTRRLIDLLNRALN